MDYEMKIFVVRSTVYDDVMSKEEENFAQILAMIDLGKVEEDHPIYVYKTSTDNSGRYPCAWIFGDVGDKEIKKDRYGKPFRLLPIKEVMLALQSSTYPRGKSAYALLESFTDESDVFAILYGH